MEEVDHLKVAESEVEGEVSNGKQENGLKENCNQVIDPLPLEHYFSLV